MDADTPLWFFILLSFCMWLFTDEEASGSFCVKGMKPVSDHHMKVLTATRQQSPFSPLVCIILWILLLSFSFSPSLKERVNEREKVALCLLFASHSKWQLWLSCSNWTLLQIRRANNRPLWWMGRVAVCVVVSSERNRYAISDESHAKSRGYKEL